MPVSDTPEDIRERIDNGEFSTDVYEYMTDEERSDALLRESEELEDMHLDEEYAHLYGKHIDDMSVPGYITGQQTDLQYGDKNIDDMEIPVGTFVQQPVALYGDKTINDMQIPPEASVTDESEFSQD